MTPASTLRARSPTAADELPNSASGHLDDLVRFLRHFAHDARNAAFPLQVQVHLMGGGDAEGRSGTVGEALTVFLDHHKQLLRVLDRATEIMDSGRSLEFADVDVARTLQSSIRGMQARLEQKHQQLTLDVPDEPLKVKGDAEMLHRALTELLDNAVRYTPPNGAIDVRAAQAAEAVQIRIRDSGPGVDPTVLPRLFAPFCCERLKPLDGRAGLGLALVRQIAELHGGRAALETSGGPGAEFSLQLPRAVS